MDAIVRLMSKKEEKCADAEQIFILMMEVVSSLDKGFILTTAFPILDERPKLASEAIQKAAKAAAHFM